MNTGKISQILYDDKCPKPVLINFQNGTLPLSKCDRFECNLYLDETEHVIPAVASEKFLYTGRVSKEDELYNNFILTRNTKTGECKLICVDKALVKITSKNKRKLATVDTPAVKQLADLQKYFGSKKTKMATEQKERLTVDVENIKSSLEQTAKETEITASAILPFKPDENDNSYRPPINRNANKVEDIYPLNVLLPTEILDELRESAEKYLGEEEANLTFCEFIKKEFVKLQSSTSSGTIKKAQILLYIDSLVNLIKQPAKSIASKKFVACPYSSKVSAYILSNFTLTSATGRTRPMSMRDKCVCYVLVLSMLAFNYAINIEIFIRDLKLGVKKLQDISKILGFRSKSSDKNSVTLSLPLPPPVTAPTGKKRR